MLTDVRFSYRAVSALTTACQPLKAVMALLCIATLCIPAGAATSKQDTLSYCSKRHGGFYYRDPSITALASRFNLARPCTVQGVIITLTGDSGSCRLRLFGREGGINAPVLEEDLVPPLSVHKSKQGVERIYVPIKESGRLTGRQFYVCLDEMKKGMYVLTDTVTKAIWCEAGNGDKFYYQMLKTKNTAGVEKWSYSKYAFMIEPVVEFEEKSEPVFSYESKYIISENLTNESKNKKSDEAATEEASGKAIALPPPNNYSIACADINGDGYMDVLNNGRLYLNEKGVFLREISSAAGISGSPKANVFIDLNNDGLTDILFLGSRDSSFENAEAFINLNGTSFLKRSIALPPIINPLSYSIADINGDGYGDIVIAQGTSGKEEQKTQPCLLLINDKNNGFSDQSSVLSTAGVHLRTCTTVAFVDVNNDGRSDLHLNGTDATTGKAMKYILFAQGSGYKAVEFGDELAVTKGNTTSSSTNSASNQSLKVVDVGASWADVDNDGVSDLLSPQIVRYNSYKASGGAHSRVYHNNGAPDYSLAAAERNLLPYNEMQSGGVWGDINNDGRLDCILTTGCECRFADVYVQGRAMEFNGVSQEYGLEELHNNRDAIWLDADNDGRLDLLVVQNDELRLYKNNNQSSANYISILPQPQKGSAISGIKASVYANGKVIVREVIAGRGLLMQDPPVIHVGLGGSTSIDSVVIDWGNNHRERFDDLSANTQHRLQENTAGERSGMEVAHLETKPNPFSNAVSISYTLASPEKALSLSVYAINGRLIKHLVEGQSREKGSYTIEWDGKDANGTAVPSGTYILRLRLGNSEIVTRMTRVE